MSKLQKGARQLLEPVDLLNSIRLGQKALVDGLDPSQGYMPYWCIRAGEEGLQAFSHAGAWDWCHNVARMLHALGMAEELTGTPVKEDIWSRLADLLIALFDESDDLPGAPDDTTGERFVHLHNIRENTHGLAALIRRGDERAVLWSRRMVRRMLEAVDEDGQIHLDRLPPYVSEYNYQPSQEGRAVDALLRLFHVTGDEAALDLAGRMTAYALDHCFTREGRIREEAGTHGHSLNAMAAGMVDLALTVRDAQLLERVKALYDVGLPRFNSSFGWSMESLHRFNHRGESNNTGDLLRAALLLGRAGWPSCFEDAERILRGHLLPSQVIDVEDLPDEDSDEDARHRRASRLRGGFSFPTPNDLLLEPDSALVTYDITSGAVDGLGEAYRAVVTEEEQLTRINLLFSRETEGLRVTSHLSGEGRLEIENRRGKSILLRLPSWVEKEDLKLRIGDREVPRRFRGSHLLIPGGERKSPITVTFPVRKVRTEESICYVNYSIDWCGDQIVAMSPPAQHRPMFPGCE